jgi:hypothetical protein
MKRWFRVWSGNIEILFNTNLLLKQNNEFRTRLERQSDDIRVLNAALGRIIAKLDPMYGVPEDDSARRAASDKLSNEIIARLKAEDASRRHTTGEL